MFQETLVRIYYILRESITLKIFSGTMKIAKITAIFKFAKKKEVVKNNRIISSHGYA